MVAGIVCDLWVCENDLWREVPYLFSPVLKLQGGRWTDATKIVFIAPNLRGHFSEYIDVSHQATTVQAPISLPARRRREDFLLQGPKVTEDRTQRERERVSSLSTILHISRVPLQRRRHTILPEQIQQNINSFQLLQIIGSKHEGSTAWKLGCLARTMSRSTSSR